MIIIKIIDYIKGFVKINIQGHFIERFINVCMRRNIHLWDIENIDKNKMNMNISIKGFKLLRPVARKTKTKVKIIKKKGLPFFFSRYRRRKLFIIGIVIMLFALYYITSLVLIIDIKGNSIVSDEKILSSLENNGFKLGMRSSKIDMINIQNGVMLEIDELSWMWVSIDGIKATVEVKEKVPVPKIIDKNTPCNIISSKDGVVSSISATNGKRVVGVGDVVSKGDLLISGIIGSRDEGYKFMHSSGNVMARTWYEKSVKIPLFKENYALTGKKIKKSTVNFFGFGVKLYLKNEIPYEHYKSSGIVRRMKLFGNYYLPFSFSNSTYEECVKNEISISEKEAYDIGMKEIQKELEKIFSQNTSVLSIDGFYEKVDDRNILVTANYECIEDIGVLVELKDIEENYKDTE